MEAEESDEMTGGKGSTEFQADEAAAAAAEESETQAMSPSLSQETHPMTSSMNDEARSLKLERRDANAEC